MEPSRWLREPDGSMCLGLWSTGSSIGGIPIFKFDNGWFGSICATMDSETAW